MDMKERMIVIDHLANEDEAYCEMLERLRTMEHQWDRVLSAIPEDQRDILCDYFTLCEEMSRRKLELACAHMCFCV